MAGTVSAARTRAHDHKQLAAVLGWPPAHVDKAVALGVLPEYDRPRTCRWSGRLTDQIEARGGEYAAALDLTLLLDGEELKALLGFDWHDWAAGRQHKIIPGPDQGGFWSRSLAFGLAGRKEELREKIPPRPLGAKRLVAEMRELSGIELVPEDFKALVNSGAVGLVDYWEEWPLYDTAAARRLATTGEGRELLAETVAGRLLGPDRAAGHMRIRRKDFDYLTAGGMLTPAGHETREVGGGFKQVTVPLYLASDLDEALEASSGIDWDEVRSVSPGAPSALRKHASLLVPRAAAVRSFCAGLAAGGDVDVWARYRNRQDRWEIDWASRTGGDGPGEEEVARALAGHPEASRYAGQVVLLSEFGDAVRMARYCLAEPGRAIIVDWETADLYGVGLELAGIDACTGETVIDTLVSPDGEQVEPGARAVHGITDEELAGAPLWRDVAPAFLKAAAGKLVLSYNAPFDRETTVITHRHAGLPESQLRGLQWRCVMQARSDWYGIRGRLRLDGHRSGDRAHRALGDAHAARQVLKDIAATPGHFR